MCGIAGQVGRDPRAIQAHYGAYCAMQQTLARRGPDQRGMYISGRAALIHARLAVVDLENGLQPMQLDWKGETYVLVYNGELYNTSELRAALANRGHSFTGHSDTEVLLHAFAEWGTDCVERCNGIFAFAVWRVNAGTLFLARDRCGVKPLFYTQAEDSLIFGSELKTLLAHPAVPPRIDANGLAEVLLLGPGRTPGCGVFQNVRELLPGQCATYDADTARLTLHTYWQLTDHDHPDEIFGGYPWYRDPAVREKYGFPWAQSTAYRVSLLKPGVLGGIDPAAFVDTRYQQTLAETSIRPGLPAAERRMRQMVNLNFKWFMQTLLDRKDRMSMYSGLEVRVPFCDYRIAEYLYSVPWEFKDWGGQEKGLLREAMRGVLPDEVLWRRKSPYPKTWNPSYLAAVTAELRGILVDPAAPILRIIKADALETLLASGTDNPIPWYGQLMTTPQTIAWFVQLNYWLEKYKVELV